MELYIGCQVLLRKEIINDFLYHEFFIREAIQYDLIGVFLGYMDDYAKVSFQEEYEINKNLADITFKIIIDNKEILYNLVNVKELEIIDDAIIKF